MFYLYITYDLNNKFHSIGVTTDMKRRLKILNMKKEFYKIVYFECFEDSTIATKRENEFLRTQKDVICEIVKENNPSLVNLVNI